MNPIRQARLEASRPMGVAQELTGQQLDEEVIYSKVVVLTGEAEVLNTDNGHWIFLNSMRLLSRVVGQLQVAIPEGAARLTAEVDSLLKTLWSQRQVQRVPITDLQLTHAAAILSVGRQTEPNLPWTAVTSNGWVARCTSGRAPLAGDTRQANPVGAVLAASLGVTEVFKRVYGVPVEVAPLMEDAAFSLFEMSETFKNDGPELPSIIKLPPTLLLGGGAIGNGLVLLLSQLPLSGWLLLMDKQAFAKENRGTCCLLDEQDWLTRPKAEALAEWLRVNSKLEVNSLSCTVESAMEDGELNGMDINLVLNGLDDIAARRAVQNLWPSLLVDGAINSQGASVVTHSSSRPQWACMRCTFTEPVADHRHLQVKATGLSMESLSSEPNRLLTDEDIVNAEEGARGWLQEQMRQGKTLCSTVSQGMQDRLGLNLDEGFRPSVPFVATASAAMVIAQMLRNLLWQEEAFIHECQFGNLFIGPSTGVRVRRLASPTCQCTTARPTIERLQASRVARRSNANGELTT